jgi:hypothetical protein
VIFLLFVAETNFVFTKLNMHGGKVFGVVWVEFREETSCDDETVSYSCWRWTSIIQKINKAINKLLLINPQITLNACP